MIIKNSINEGTGSDSCAPTCSADSVPFERQYKVECFNGEKWVLLSAEWTRESAEKTANFMRLGQPRPGSVRIIEPNSER